MTRQENRCEGCDHLVSEHSTSFDGKHVNLVCNRDCPCDKFISIEKMLSW